MSNYGYSGSSYDRFVENTNTSTLHKMKETYWTTKQAVIKKLGKKEDEHVVASDSQLDAKLEVFRAIQKSSMDLLRVIERYQDRLCVVSQDENTMGRMLKSHGNKDKTRAGKMMAAVGKGESSSAQERLALHNPLRRLYQEVETFRYRAVSDTLVTINRMESARTEYRGALLWMKNVSEELDPDMYKQLEKFRKVQAQVRKTKARFDKLKLDVMQKVDLLAASRCNMFSHVLANYQTMLLHYWEKTSRTMTAVAESFKGYQYYEFNMLKELTEPCRKLTLETSNQSAEKETEDGDNAQSQDYDDKLLGGGLNLSGTQKAKEEGFGPFTSAAGGDDDLLLRDDEEDDMDFTGKIMETVAKNREVQKNDGKPKDLLTDGMETADDDDAHKDDMTILNEILNAPPTGEDEFTTEWTAVFGGSMSASVSSEMASTEPDASTNQAGFLPSSLLDIQLTGDPFSSNSSTVTPTMTQDQATHGGNHTDMSKGAKSKSASLAKPGPSSDLSAWFNLFADLDPLSNPDAIGRKTDDMTDA